MQLQANGTGPNAAPNAAPEAAAPEATQLQGAGVGPARRPLLDRWRCDMRACAAAFVGAALLFVALVVALSFTLPRPRSQHQHPNGTARL